MKILNTLLQNFCDTIMEPFRTPWHATPTFLNNQRRDNTLLDNLVERVVPL